MLHDTSGANEKLSNVHSRGANVAPLKILEEKMPSTYTRGANNTRN